MIIDTVGVNTKRCQPEKTKESNWEWTGKHLWGEYMYVLGSKSFRPDIQKPRQMENAVRDI